MYRYDQFVTDSQEILPISKFFKEGGEFVALCPHCQRSIAIEDEFDGITSLEGEQYQHRCKGWIEVRNGNAVKTPREAGLD